MEQNVVSMVDFLKEQNERLSAENAKYEQEVDVLLCTECGSKEFMLSANDSQIFCATCTASTFAKWIPDT
jgi:hypothetical protein